MKFAAIFAFVLGALALPASAQTLLFGFGDVELETTLNSLNVTAKADISGATVEISLQWGVPAVQVTAALSKNLAPAEVYVAAFMAQTSGKPLETVVSLYTKDKKAGWGALAKALGIKPGSKAFKNLKDKSVTATSKLKGKKDKGKEKV